MTDLPLLHPVLETRAIASLREERLLHPLNPKVMRHDDSLGDAQDSIIIDINGYTLRY